MPAAARRPGRSSCQFSRPSSAAEARLVEKDKLSAAYMRDRRKRIDALREGERGAEVVDLIRFLRSMTLKSGKELVARIEAAEWAQGMSADDRHLILTIIGSADRQHARARGATPVR